MHFELSKTTTKSFVEFISFYPEQFETVVSHKNFQFFYSQESSQCYTVRMITKQSDSFQHITSILSTSTSDVLQDRPPYLHLHMFSIFSPYHTLLPTLPNLGHHRNVIFMYHQPLPALFIPLIERAVSQ